MKTPSIKIMYSNNSWHYLMNFDETITIKPDEIVYKKEWLANRDRQEGFPKIEGAGHDISWSIRSLEEKAFDVFAKCVLDFLDQNPDAEKVCDVPSTLISVTLLENGKRKTIKKEFYFEFPELLKIVLTNFIDGLAPKGTKLGIFIDEEIKE